MPELTDAIEAIRAGGVVGVPTDTVYGLAVDPHDPAAVERLFEIKGRAAEAPIVVLAASGEQARGLGDIAGRARIDTEAHWPGALTVVVPALQTLAPGVGNPETGTIGLRVPDHDLCRALLAATGPLAVTSANRSGEAPATGPEGAFAQLGDAIAVYLPGTCRSGRSSTVVDYTKEPPLVLRDGPVAIQDGPDS